MSSGRPAPDVASSDRIPLGAATKRYTEVLARIAEGPADGSTHATVSELSLLGWPRKYRLEDAGRWPAAYGTASGALSV